MMAPRVSLRSETFVVEGDVFIVQCSDDERDGFERLHVAEVAWLLERWDREGRGWVLQRLAEAIGHPLGLSCAGHGAGALVHVLRCGLERVALLRHRPSRPVLRYDRQVTNLSDLLVEDEPPAASSLAQEHDIEVFVLDDARVPVVGTRWEIALPTGDQRSGRTDEFGSFRIEGLGKGGDCVIALPDLELFDIVRPTDAVHEIIALSVRLVDLRIVAWQWPPLSQHACELRGEAAVATMSSDDAGQLTFRLRSPKLHATARLEVDSAQHGYRDPIPVRLAPLQPVDTPAGQRHRLDNLGYIGLFDEDDDVPSAYAIEEFQCDHNLKVDGTCGDKTQAKLVEIHGQ